MTHQYQFVLIDQTTEATPEAMRPGPVLEQVAAAIFEQVDNEFGEHYGSIVEMRVGAGVEDREPGEIAVNFRDTIPEAPDALAYHQVTAGVPDIEVGVDLFSSLTDGSESVSVGVGHEVFETILDAGANGWKEKQDCTGLMGAEESVDPVQNTCYQAKNGVSVANFVLPSYWVPGAAGPWDYLGVLKSQEDTTQGYEIRAAAPTNVSQVSGLARGVGQNFHAGKIVWAHGEMTEAQRKRKRHPYSRTYRRGVRL